MLVSHRLDLEFDAGRLQAELEGLADDGWIPHFNTGYYDGDWSGVVLRGPPDGLDSLAGFGDQTFVDAPALEGRDYLRQVLAAFDCPLRSVRLLRLASGAEIHEHRDYDLGPDRGEVRIHIPIITHPDVEFHVRNRRVVMAAGEVWYLDLSQPHRVRNAGPVARIHLVLDMVVNDWLRARIPFDHVDDEARVVAEAVDSVSPEAASANLARFIDAVLADPDLHARLSSVMDRELFLDEAQRLGVENGLPFSQPVAAEALVHHRAHWNAAWPIR